MHLNHFFLNLVMDVLSLLYIYKKEKLNIYFPKEHNIINVYNTQK